MGDRARTSGVAFGPGALRFARDGRGGTLVEYLILVGVVALIAVAGFRAFGRTITRRITRDADCVASLDGDCPGSKAFGSGTLGMPQATAPSAAPAPPAFRDRGLQELDRLTHEVELGPVTGMPLASREPLVEAQQRAFTRAWPAVMSALGPGNSDASRVAALQLIARASNPAYFLGRESGKGIDGNCVQSAVDLVWSVRSGQLVEPAAYSDVQQARILSHAGVDLTGMGLDLPDGLARGPDAEILFPGAAVEAHHGTELEEAARESMDEGQLGLLLTYDNDDQGEFIEGHATAVVKLGGQIYNINNQEVAATHPVQTLPEWDATWQARKSPGGTTTYRLQPSNVHLPRR